MRLNKLCEIEDWQQPRLRALMCDLEPDLAAAYPGYPAGREHRKSWEYAHLIAGLEQLEALHPQAMVLAVAAGNERPLYALSRRVRWVFAIDVYGTSVFSNHEARKDMLSDPDSFALLPHNRNRLVVQYMDARDLRFEDGTFDVAYCLSSIEHFGGIAGGQKALTEMQRVLKPGGVAVLTTECIVNGAAHLSEEHFELFTPITLRRLLAAARNLTLVEPISFSLSKSTLATRPIPMDKAVHDGTRCQADYPHLLLHHAGRLFTSIALFLRKSPS